MKTTVNNKKKSGKSTIKTAQNSVLSIAERNALLIEPTTEARLEFILEFVPKWMKQFEGDDWEVAHRLEEEVNDNFQFTEEGLDGLKYKDVSLCHIIVLQQWYSRALIKQLLSKTKH